MIIKFVRSIIVILILVSASLNYAIAQVNANTSLHKADATIKSDTVKAKLDNKLIFEFSGGPSLGMTYGTTLPGKFPLLRYTVALGGSYLLSKNFGVDGKLLWEAKGSVQEYWGTDNDGMRAKVHQGYDQDYLTLALSAFYYIDCHRRLFVAGGLSASQLIDSKAFTYYYSENDELVDSYRADAATSFKKFDFGALAIVGYRRKIAKKVLITAQVLGNLGMIHVYSEPHEKPVRNANLALLLGIGIPSRY